MPRLCSAFARRPAKAPLLPALSSPLPGALLIAPRPRPLSNAPRPTPQMLPATTADSRQHSFPCPRARPVRYLLRLCFRPISPLSFLLSGLPYSPAVQGLFPSSRLPRLSSLDDGYLSSDSAPHAPPWPPMARPSPATTPTPSSPRLSTSPRCSGTETECPSLPPRPRDPADMPCARARCDRFNIYIHDYCVKRGFRKTALELQLEAAIQALHCKSWLHCYI